VELLKRETEYRVQLCTMKKGELKSIKAKHKVVA